MTLDRRHGPRTKPSGLTYVKLEETNCGAVVDACDGGLGFQVIAPVQLDDQITFTFSLDSSHMVEATGAVAWIDETRRTGGLRFTHLPDGVREQLQSWLSENNSLDGTDELASIPSLTPPSAAETTGAESEPHELVAADLDPSHGLGESETTLDSARDLAARYDAISKKEFIPGKPEPAPAIVDKWTDLKSGLNDTAREFGNPVEEIAAPADVQPAAAEIAAPAASASESVDKEVPAGATASDTPRVNWPPANDWNVPRPAPPTPPTTPPATRLGADKKPAQLPANMIDRSRIIPVTSPAAPSATPADAKAKPDSSSGWYRGVVQYMNSSITPKNRTKDTEANGKTDPGAKVSPVLLRRIVIAIILLVVLDAVVIGVFAFRRGLTALFESAGSSSDAASAQPADDANAGRKARSTSSKQKKPSTSDTSDENPQPPPPPTFSVYPTREDLSAPRPALSGTSAPDSATSAAPAVGTSGHARDVAGWDDLELAREYLIGFGHPRDTVQAARLFSTAANKGNPDAQVALSDLYIRGDGVVKNCDQARTLLLVAAKSESAASMQKLRDEYAEGCGVEPSLNPK
ncbi:MAG: PilZ domain-containing protein [Candidatus Acidiferrales bacterium]